MKCTNKVMFMIDKLDVAEMFYNENRNRILEGLKSGLKALRIAAFMNSKELEDETEVKVDIPGCLNCTFKCEVSGLDDKSGGYCYESFMDVVVWDLKEFLDSGMAMECRLKFPLIGTEDGMMEPVSSETADMADYIKDLMQNDYKLLKEVKDSFYNN